MAGFRMFRGFSWRSVQFGIQAMTGIVTFAFGIIGTSVTILVPFFSPNVQTSISSAAISIMFACFVIWSIFREYRVARKEKYANVSQALGMISVQTKELSLRLMDSLSQHDGQSTEALSRSVRELSLILDDVVTVFSMLTGTRCRATLKVVNRDETRVWAHSLARDRMSAEHCAFSDKDRNDRQFDIIQNNIDSEVLYDGNTQAPPL